MASLLARRGAGRAKLVSPAKALDGTAVPLTLSSGSTSAQGKTVMKRTLIVLFLVTLILSACKPGSVSTVPRRGAPVPDAAPTSATATSAALSPTAAVRTTSSPPAEVPHRTLPQHPTWQIQYSGKIDPFLDVDVFDLDLFDTPQSTIEALHEHGVFVICYFSAGSYEDWRPDAFRFPPEILGKEMKGWPGERWLDIRRLDLLAPIIESRLDLAVQKGCDGIDPDNVNGYANDVGFPLSADDQLRFNIFLANAAHARGLSVGLKNDLEQIPQLLPYFDWILDEECFSYNECDKLLPFLQAGKPVFVVEYELSPEEFCPQANQMGFSAIHKNRDLDAYRTNCRQLSSR
jgi:hypothetical protein